MIWEKTTQMSECRGRGHWALSLETCHYTPLGSHGPQVTRSGQDINSRHLKLKGSLGNKVAG